MTKFKVGQKVVARIGGEKQFVLIAEGYRSNQKQVCVTPLEGAKFKGQCAFMPVAYLFPNELKVIS